MNVKRLKEIIKDLPDDTIIYQETGDHDLFEPYIELTKVYNDETYGMIEQNFPQDQPSTKLAIIIR